MTKSEKSAILTEYSLGRAGTRDVIARLNIRDYADLLIELSRHDLSLPKPADFPGRERHVARARAILQPRLRHAG